MGSGISLRELKVINFLFLFFYRGGNLFKRIESSPSHHGRKAMMMRISLRELKAEIRYFSANIWRNLNLFKRIEREITNRYFFFNHVFNCSRISLRELKAFTTGSIFKNKWRENLFKRIERFLHSNICIYSFFQNLFKRIESFLQIRQFNLQNQIESL